MAFYSTLTKVVVTTKPVKILGINSLPIRCLSTSVINRQKVDPETDDEIKKEGWLKRLLPVRRIDPGKESHSSQLSEKNDVFELQIHRVKPKFMENYLNEFNDFVDLVHGKETGAKLEGSWTVEVGDQDEAIHLWSYRGGYPVLNEATKTYRKDQDFVDYRISRNKMLRSRQNQILLEFSFWPTIKPREGSSIYELRSYVLKPGTMIEWGNYWSRGIKFRQEKNENVAGYFSHIGHLYNIHHFFAYESLQSRKEIRESAWQRPGWDECVAYTVPLIRNMQSRILIPTPCSPMQ